jgi:hypothetical protein
MTKSHNPADVRTVYVNGDRPRLSYDFMLLRSCENVVECPIPPPGSLAEPANEPLQMIRVTTDVGAKGLKPFEIYLD